MQQLPDINQPGLVVFDLDSTLIQLESIDTLATLNGTSHDVAAITERAMQGELDFKSALFERVAYLEGINEEDIFALVDQIRISPGADELIQFFRSKRWKIAILSGGFTWFADQVAMRWGVDFVACNSLEVKAGKLTGKLVGEIIDAEAKASYLSALRNQYGFDSRQVIAIGDGANDIPMLTVAGLGVAFNGKAALIKVADISLQERLDQLIPFLTNESS